MAIESIAKTLGTGSGIDIKDVVGQLVEASFANKNAALTSKQEKLTTRISAAGELKSSLTSFAAALAQLTASGSLATQPTSTNTSIVNVGRLPGAALAGLNAALEVRQLAQSQVATTGSFAEGAATKVGTGSFTLSFGSASVDGGAMTGFTVGAGTPVTIPIDDKHDTLQGIADSINAAKAGVTASIVSDGSGARLVVKGATGASQAFELKGSGALSALDIGRGAGGTTIGTVAQDAFVALDGIEARYASNTISSLVPGVRLDLVTAAPGTRVTLGATRPSSALTAAANNFVETFNEVYKQAKAAVDPIDGPLRGDAAAKDLLRQLKRLTMTVLVPDAPKDMPATLADIGVATQRDGTLRLDTTRLSKVLTDFPDQVEAIFAESAGLTRAMNQISANAADKKIGLSASEATYGKQQTEVAEDKVDVLAAAETMRARMTQQFAAMDAKVAAYKSTQTFLQQQIDSWTASR